MKVKEFVESLKLAAGENEDKIVLISFDPPSNQWHYTLTTVITDIVSESNFDTVFISNAFSNERNAITVKGLINEFEAHPEYFEAELYAEIYGFDGQLHNQIICQKVESFTVEIEYDILALSMIAPTIGNAVVRN